MTLKPRFLPALFACGTLLGSLACSSEAFQPVDSTTADSGGDAAPDAGTDTGTADPDAATDAGTDGQAPAEAATPDAGADVAQDNAVDGAASDGNATDARDTGTQPIDATADKLPEASVDAPPVGTDAAPDAREGGATCYLQGQNGPLDCHTQTTPGRYYCNEMNACTLCQAPQLLNCDGNDANGCELFVNDDNCGQCGKKCNSVTTCTWHDIGGYSCDLRPDAAR